MRAENGRWSNLEHIIILALALASVVIVVLDWLGFLDSVAPLKDRVPIMTLLTIGVIAGHLFLESLRNRGRDRLVSGSVERLVTAIGELEGQTTRHADHVINSLHGVEAQEFVHRDDFYKFITRRIDSAEKTIDITHFNPTIPTREYPDRSREAETDYDRASERAIKRGVNIRRVLTVLDPHENTLAKLDWIKETCQKFHGAPFFLRYYDASPFPVLNLMIIDGYEVAIGGLHHDLSEKGKSFWIKHPHIPGIVQDYFDNVLWKTAKELNDPQLKFLDDRLEQIRQRFLSPMPANMPVIIKGHKALYDLSCEIMHKSTTERLWTTAMNPNPSPTTEELRWIEQRKTALGKRDVESRSVMAVNSVKDLDNEMSDLQTLRDVPNALVSCYVAVPPSINIFISDDEELLIGLYTKQASLGMDSCIRIRDRDVVDQVANWYNNYLWNGAIPLKDKRGIIPENVEAVKGMLRIIESLRTL
jgi:hypothetical protein